MENLVVNCEVAVAQRFFEEAARIEEQAAALDDEALAQTLTAAAERTRAEGYAAILAADSIPDDTKPEDLDPVQFVPLTEEEEADREALGVAVAWSILRSNRDALLAESDWRVQPDAPSDLEAWTKYRQQLRDLPNITTDPAAVEWPTPPD